MGGADQRRGLTAIFRPRNYRAFFLSLRTYRNPLDGLARYVFSRGSYPWKARLRTPTGPVELDVPHPHDVRTVNEVFMRHDYGTDRPRVVVDVGANIGVSAAFFLSRRADAVVHCWEPHPRNLMTLRSNLAPFGERVHIHPAALAPTAGRATFVAEGVGRYSGLADYVGVHAEADEITVQCESVADALRSVIASEGQIDLLKIDTEGSEQVLVRSIPDDVWDRLGEVVYELPGRVVRQHGRLRRERAVG